MFHVKHFGVRSRGIRAFERGRGSAFGWEKWALADVAKRELVR